MIKLSTDRLTIRDLNINDLEEHYKLMSNNNVMYYLQDLKKNSIEESKDDLIKTVNDINSKDRKYYFLLIENKISNEFIGEIGYTVINNTPYGKLVDLGYFINEKHWNKGYTTEALKRVIEFAFEENDVYRIKTGCIKENIGSEKVMQKNGLIKEGEFKEYVYHDGKFKDRIQYRLLKNEWKNNSVRLPIA
jgi:ribosomal-protein-alanine N-acetyltransferase